MNFFTFTKLWRILLLSAVVAVGAVCLVSCVVGGDDDPDDNNSDNGGDNGIYDYVELGGLKWMTRNLNVETAEGSWCYDGNPANCRTYGRLYDWDAAKSACRSIGWRLPDALDWDRLVEAAGGDEAGKKLKSTSGWDDHSDGSGNGTNEFGFSALPGGRRNNYGSSDNAGFVGTWWTATEDGGSVYPFAFYRYIVNNEDDVHGDSYHIGFGRSVRCIKYN
jgi:uncharacterized protein (TIGR02145 family)